MVAMPNHKMEEASVSTHETLNPTYDVDRHHASSSPLSRSSASVSDKEQRDRHIEDVNAPADGTLNPAYDATRHHAGDSVSPKGVSVDTSETKRVSLESLLDRSSRENEDLTSNQQLERRDLPERRYDVSEQAINQLKERMSAVFDGGYVRRLYEKKFTFIMMDRFLAHP